MSSQGESKRCVNVKEIKVTSQWLVTDVIVPLIFSVIVVGLFTTFVGRTAHVSSSSMEPTIVTDSRLAIQMIQYPKYLDYGDIVVFKSEEFGKNFIKRLIAKGGDTVVLYETGEVKVNDVIISEPYLTDDTIIQEAKTFKVPVNHFFFLGDNRMNSNDARTWQQPYIPQEAILAKAVGVITPLSKMRWLN